MLDARNVLRGAALRNSNGILQINGCRLPVTIKTITETTGEYPRIECEAIAPDANAHYTDYTAYARRDIEMAAAWHNHLKMRNTMTIKNVIFNPPATIVFWNDGTKTVVKCQEMDIYDPEKGLAMAIVKKSMGNKGNYNNVFAKWTERYYQQQNERLEQLDAMNLGCDWDEVKRNLAEVIKKWNAFKKEAES